MDLFESILSDLRRKQSPRKRAQVVVEGGLSAAARSLPPRVDSSQTVTPTPGRKRRLISAAAVVGEKRTKKQSQTPPLIEWSTVTHLSLPSHISPPVPIGISVPLSTDVPALTPSDNRKGRSLMEGSTVTRLSPPVPIGISAPSFVASVWTRGQELFESLYKATWAKKSLDEKAKAKDTFVPDWSITQSDTLCDMPTAQAYLLHSIPPLDREMNQEMTRSDRAEMLCAITALLVNLVGGELLDVGEMQKELKGLHERVDTLMAQKEELLNSYNDALNWKAKYKRRWKDAKQYLAKLKEDNVQLNSALMKALKESGDHEVSLSHSSALLDNLEMTKETLSKQLSDLGSTNEALIQQLSDLGSTNEMLMKQLSEVFDEDGDFSVAALIKSPNVHEIVRTYNMPAVHATYIRTYEVLKRLNPNMLIDEDFHQILYRPDVASIVPPWCNPQDLSPTQPSHEDIGRVMGGYNQDLVQLGLRGALSPTWRRIIEREEGTSSGKRPTEGVVGGHGNGGTGLGSAEPLSSLPLGSSLEGPAPKDPISLLDDSDIEDSTPLSLRRARKTANVVLSTSSSSH